MRLVAYKLDARERREVGGDRRRAANRGSRVDGESLFAEHCAGCHALAAAGSPEGVGPDLDGLRPDRTRVARQVADGGGGMPSFAGRLSAREIAAIARYVARVAGR